MGNTSTNLPRSHAESQTSSIQPNVWRVDVSLMRGNEGYLFNEDKTDQEFEQHLISQPWLSNKRRNGGKGITPLFLATLSNRPVRVRLLLLHGADTETSCGTSRSTALHVACLQGCLEIIKDLLHYGANPSSIDDNGRTPLHAAAACSKYHAHEVVKLILVTGISINTRDHAQRTALHIACLSHYLFQGHHRYLHVAEILLLNGIDFTLTDNTNRKAFECIDVEECRNLFVNSYAYQKAQRARRRRAFVIVMHQKDFSLGLQRLTSTLRSSSSNRDQIVVSTAAVNTNSIPTGDSTTSGDCGSDSISSYLDVPHSDTHTHTDSHPYSDRYPYPYTNPGPVPNTMTTTPPIPPILTSNDIITPSPILSPRPRLALGFHAPENGSFPSPCPPPPPPIIVPSNSREVYLPVFGRVRSLSLTGLFTKKTGPKTDKNNSSPSPRPSPSPSSSPPPSPNSTDNPSPNRNVTVTGRRHYPATFKVFASPEMCANICGYL